MLHKADFVLLFLVIWQMAGGLMSYMAGKTNKTFRDYIAWTVSLIELAAVLAILRYDNLSLSL
ncbi:MAG: hypothetical protein IJ576_08090, partial [Synergistaceae bacterium]|nr:hypothetical protein [Synergistaceae bacterium]